MDESPKANSGLWSVLEELAKLDKDPHFEGSRIIDRKPDLEACLRRVLRPHDEAGFEAREDQWMIVLRERLDAALEVLTYREIRYQLCLTTESLPSQTQDHLRVLFRSEAFLRYINAYLYFGIRFLSGRDKLQQAQEGRKPAPCADSNVRSLPLMPPPALVDSPGAEAQLGRFAGLPTKGSVATALLFLDDFHPQRQESVQFELQEPSE